MNKKIINRFWVRVNITKNCWEWIGGKNKQGYGKFRFNGKMVYSHRFNYELFISKIPNGLHIDHLCKNTSCVNPYHMDIVTHKENIRRSNLRGDNPRSNKTHCPKGHIYSGDNLGVYKNNRYCKICKSDTDNKKYVKLKQSIKKSKGKKKI